MHVFTYLVLSFLGIALSLPLFRAEHKRDSILTLSPTVDLGLNLSNDNSCLGIGISVCDPITVNSTTTDTATKSKAKTDSDSSSSSPSPSTTPDDATATSGDSLINTTGASGDSLINISPTITPDLNLSNDNSCLGIGISACDPITVGSTVTKTVTEESDDDDTADDSSSDAPASTYPTSAPASTAASTGDSLINLSPSSSPDINLSNDNGCLGIGISACDPITVDSIVNKTVTG